MIVMDLSRLIKFYYSKTNILTFFILYTTCSFASLIDRLVNIGADRRKIEQQDENEKELAAIKMLKRRMGIKYYLMPWRIPIERARLARIAAIEEEMENVRAETKALTSEQKTSA